MRCGHMGGRLREEDQLLVEAHGHLLAIRLFLHKVAWVSGVSLDVSTHLHDKEGHFCSLANYKKEQKEACPPDLAKQVEQRWAVEAQERTRLRSV